MVQRVTATESALTLIRHLKEQHGPLLFHQSGGCCDGSAPMCFCRSEFKIGEHDLLLGWLDDCPFFMSSVQFEYWSHTQLIIDVVPGRGASFSLEIPEGVRFLTRSRLFSDDEADALTAAGPPPAGPSAAGLPA